MVGTDSHTTSHGALNAFAFGIGATVLPSETPQFAFADNLVTAPDIEASEGDELELTADKVVNQTTGKSFAVVPLPKARQAIIDAGGLIAYTRQRVLEAAKG